MSEDTPPKNSRAPYAVRGLALFLALLLLVPGIKESLDIPLFKWENGEFKLYNLFLTLTLALLLPALIFNQSEQLEVPILKKWLKND